MLILKKIPLFTLPPDLQVSRMVRLLLTIFLLLSLMTTCQEPPPPKPEPYPNTSLTLQAIQVNSIDVQLKLSLTNLDSLTGDTLPIILSRDGHTIQTFDFIPPDTSQWDEGLEPNRTYTYTAYRQSVHNSSLVDSSNTISLTTMDTTSHDFTWTIDTLGDYGTQLNDVEIISADNIWVVGEIETDSGSYNATHWDGERWEMLRIVPPPFLFAPLTSIYALSATNVWVAGTAPMEFDGETWNATPTYPTSGWINAIWGSSSEDVWFVGRGGSIVHYDGDTFTKIDQSYDTDYRDVVGTPDGEHLFMLGAPEFRGGDWVVLYYSDDSQEWVSLPNPFSLSIPGLIERYSMDLLDDKLYIPTEEGIWTYSLKTHASETTPKYEIEYGLGLFMSTIAIQKNDIFYAGLKMDFLHFNGKSYKYIDEIQYNFSHLVMEGGDYNGEIFAMVGYSGTWQHGIVARGYRY